MSVQALTWSFGLLLPDMAAKAVLHALANHADEYGRCWPSIQTIARSAGCNEKTARRALKRVADLGLVTREERAGRSDLFTLNLEMSIEGKIAEKPGATSMENLQTLCRVSNRAKGMMNDSLFWESQNRQSLNRELPSSPGPLPKAAGDPSLKRPEPLPNQGAEPSEPPKNRKGTTNERGTRLPTDWQPSENLVTFAEGLGLDAQAIAAEFRDYWRSVPGARGLKLDWEATFRNRCRAKAGESARRPQAVRATRRGSELAAFVRGASRVVGDEPIQ